MIMKQGKMLPPGAGRLIAGGALHAMLKVSGGPRGDGAVCSSFEITVPPGYDVGAHVHTRGEELFYVLEGTLDLLAFEPVERTPEDWHAWTSPTGQRYLRPGQEPRGIVDFPSRGVRSGLCREFRCHIDERTAPEFWCGD